MITPQVVIVTEIQLGVGSWASQVTLRYDLMWSSHVCTVPAPQCGWAEAGGSVCLQCLVLCLLRPPAEPSALAPAQVWSTYSPVKNSPADALAKAKAGGPSHSATTGELDIYKTNCRQAVRLPHSCASCASCWITRPTAGRSPYLSTAGKGSELWSLPARHMAEMV